MTRSCQLTTTSIQRIRQHAPTKPNTAMITATIPRTIMNVALLTIMSDKSTPIPSSSSFEDLDSTFENMSAIAPSSTLAVMPNPSITPPASCTRQHLHYNNMKAWNLVSKKPVTPWLPTMQLHAPISSCPDIGTGQHTGTRIANFTHLLPVQGWHCEFMHDLHRWNPETWGSSSAMDSMGLSVYLHSLLRSKLQKNRHYGSVVRYGESSHPRTHKFIQIESTYGTSYQWKIVIHVPRQCNKNLEIAIFMPSRIV